MDPENAGNSVSGRTCCNRGKDRSPRRHDSTKRRPTFQTEWGNWGNSIVEPFLHLLFTLQNNAITAEQFAHRCTSLPRDSRHVYLLAAEKAEYEDAVNMAKTAGIQLAKDKLPSHFIIIFPRELADLEASPAVLRSQLWEASERDWTIFLAAVLRDNETWKQRWRFIVDEQKRRCAKSWSFPR